MGWQQSVFQLLIVEASGGFSGLFVYAPTPGTGNLIASVAAQSGTDPFGNAYKAGFTSYGVSGSFVNLLNNLVSIGTTPTGVAGTITGGGGQVNFASGRADPVDLAAGLVLISRDLTVGGVNPQVLVGPTVAPNPITGEMLEVQGNLAVEGTVFPIVGGTEETWHTFALTGVSAGTDINGTSYPPAYRMLPSGNVELRGVVVAPGGGLPAATTWAVIPAAYRPATNVPTALVANGNLGTLAHVYVRPNGNMQFDAALGGGVSMYLDSTLNVAGT